MDRVDVAGLVIGAIVGALVAAPTVLVLAGKRADSAPVPGWTLSRVECCEFGRAKAVEVEHFPTRDECAVGAVTEQRAVGGGSVFVCEPRR